MEKATQKNRVTAIQAYLHGIDKPISSTQAYEVLARALGYKNKHVLAAATGMEETSSLPRFVFIKGTKVAVLWPEDPPLTIERMTRLDWNFDFIVPLPVGALGDIEAINSEASRRLTGEESALEDIGFTHVTQVAYPAGFVAYRITGIVGSPRDYFDFKDESQFYLELAELLSRVEPQRSISVGDVGSSGCLQGVITSVNGNALEVLRTYAQSKGENNDAVNAMAAQDLFTWKRLNAHAGETLQVTVEEVKYAGKIDATTWRVSSAQGQVDLMV